MFIVSNRLFVAEAFAQEFQQRFADRATKMKANPGFIRLQIHKPVGKEGAWSVHTQWQDQASFKAWVQSADFKEAHANPLPPEAFTAAGSMEQHEVVVDSDAN